MTSWKGLQSDETLFRAYYCIQKTERNDFVSCNCCVSMWVYNFIFSELRSHPLDWPMCVHNATKMYPHLTLMLPFLVFFFNFATFTPYVFVRMQMSLIRFVLYTHTHTHKVAFVCNIALLSVTMPTCQRGQKTQQVDFGGKLRWCEVICNCRLWLLLLSRKII